MSKEYDVLVSILCSDIDFEQIEKENSMFNLMCVHPFENYIKGQMITDSEEVAKLQEDREHHFVRIAKPPEPALEPESAPVDESKISKVSKVF